MTKNIVLVTGARGFLGRNTCNIFKQHGWFVLGVGPGDWGKDGTKKWDIDVWKNSTVTIDCLLELRKIPSVIVHCAGSGSVSNSITNPREDFEANVLSLLPVLEFMRLKCPKAKLIYPSSAAVYGKKEDVSIKEADSLKPISPYGYHKKIAEELCESYSNNFNLNISIIRFFSIYGPGLKKQLLWDACEKINKAEKDIIFFGTGQETRDWIHIKDAVNLILKISESKKKIEIINGGSGTRVNIKQLLEMLVHEYNKKVKLIFNGDVKIGDPKYYHADMSKAKKYGWAPKIKLKDGIKDYVNFYKLNQ